MGENGEKDGGAKPSCRVDDRDKSINDTWVHRLVVIACIWLFGWCRPRNSTVLFLTSRHCIKNGPLQHLPEASSLVFVAQKTSIPVPKVYCAFKRKGWTYIVMQRVQGESLTRNWTSRSAESKARVLLQLKDMVDEMRRLPAPSTAVANVDGGSIWDCRLPGKSLALGPFDNIAAFHQHLRGGLNNISERLPPDVNNLIRLHEREWGTPVFTHGDLSSLNIMAKGDIITAIVDWETAGWYPYYWEYTTAQQVNHRNPFWREEIDKFLQAWPEELDMEKHRQARFGDV